MSKHPAAGTNGSSACTTTTAAHTTNGCSPTGFWCFSSTTAKSSIITGRIGDPNHAVGNGVLLWFGNISDFDGAVARAQELVARVVRPPHRNPPDGDGNGPSHREFWIEDPDGYTVVIASPDGEAHEPQ